HRALPSFPTRRSSDLAARAGGPGQEKLHRAERTNPPDRTRARADAAGAGARAGAIGRSRVPMPPGGVPAVLRRRSVVDDMALARSEEHTSELQSRENL